jgi:dihydroorotate dehydrogenase (NAD+) catalytic subunit
MTDSTPPAPTDHATRLGPVTLATPLVAASGTVGSVVDFAAVGAMEAYGAAVAKSVSDEPWSGRPAPRLAPTEAGMLNGIGIQNPGIAAWVEEVGRRIERVGVPVWGSAVGHTAQAGVAAVEVNLSCPNLDRGRMFALDPEPAAEVVAAVRGATSRPIGAKLSPNADDVVAVATAVAAAGADWVVLTNTVWGMAIDVHDRRPVLSGAVGGYSGRAIKPISLRCVWEVAHALPGLPIVGCGGVATGFDVVEYLLAGANAVAIGTAHFAEPRAGRRILAEVDEYCLTHGVGRVADLVGAAEAWQ